MKKIVSIILGIVIFAIPCFAFAAAEWDSGYGSSVLPLSPSILQFPSSNEQGLEVRYNNYATHSSEDGVYYYYLERENQPQLIVFWSYSPSVVDFSYIASGSDSPISSTINLNYDSGREIYFSYHAFWPYSSFSYSPSIIADNIGQSLDLAVQSSPYPDNSALATLSYIVHGSVSWLSAVVDGVLQAPMLLFLILSSFIGIAVGLLFRFRRG